MKKLFFLLLLIPFLSKAQTGTGYPVVTAQGSTFQLTYHQGSFGAMKGFVFRGTYSDTTAANLGFIKDVPGQTIRTIDDKIWMRSNDMQRWILINAAIVDLSGYYTKTELQTSGQANVHWGNITNAPAFITQNFANADLTLTGNRKHNAVGFNLQIDSTNQFIVNNKANAANGIRTFAQLTTLGASFGSTGGGGFAYLNVQPGNRNVNITTSDGTNGGSIDVTPTNIIFQTTAGSYQFNNMPVFSGSESIIAYNTTTKKIGYRTTLPASAITEADPIWTGVANNYYTKTNLQTSGQANVHWGNITNAQNFAIADLTFTGNRKHNANAFNLQIDSTNQFIVNNKANANGMKSFLQMYNNGANIGMNGDGSTGWAFVQVTGTGRSIGMTTSDGANTGLIQVTPTNINLQSSTGSYQFYNLPQFLGSEAIVAFNTTTNKIGYRTTLPASAITEADPIWTAVANNYYTKTDLQTSGQANVHWGNITNAPAFLTAETDPNAVRTFGTQIGISGIKSWTSQHVFGEGLLWKTSLQSGGNSLGQLSNYTDGTYRYGIITLGSDKNGFQASFLPTNLTGNWNYQLPDASGTLALTSQLAGFITQAQADVRYQGALTLTTTGTSGAATLIGNTLNIPQYAVAGGSDGNNYPTALTYSTDILTLDRSGLSSLTATLPFSSYYTKTQSDARYLASYTETDPVVKAINGLVKSNGTTIGAVVSGTDIKTINGSSILGSGNLTISGAATNLALGTATTTTLPITNSNGTGFTLPVFSSTAGLVPGTGGTSNTTDFLRRDGSWAAPPSGSSLPALANSHLYVGNIVGAPVDAGNDMIFDNANARLNVYGTSANGNIFIGKESTNFGGIWFGESVPDNTNYAFLGSTGYTLFNVKNSGTMEFRYNNTPVAKMADYRWAFGYGADPLANVTHYINTGNASYTGSIVRGVASQTANLQEWQNNTGGLIASVSPTTTTLKAQGISSNKVFDVQRSDGTTSLSVKEKGALFTPLVTIDGGGGVNEQTLSIQNMGGGYGGVVFGWASNQNLQLNVFPGTTPTWQSTNNAQAWHVTNEVYDNPEASFTFGQDGRTASKTTFLIQGQDAQTGKLFDVQKLVGSTFSSVFNVTPTAITSSILSDGTGVSKMVTVNNGVFGYQSIPSGGSGVTNLALGTATATTQPVTNSNGTGFTLPSATATTAGLMPANLYLQALKNTYFSNLGALDSVMRPIDDSTFGFKSIRLTPGSNVSITPTITDDEITYQISATGGTGGGSYVFTNSIIESAGTVKLVNDAATPGNYKVYGTNGSGVRGYQSSAVINLTSVANQHILYYDNATGTWINTPVKTIGGNSIFGTGDIPASGGGASYSFTNSITESSGTVKLVNDAATPGNNKVYGTDGTGVRGYQSSAVMNLTSPANNDILKLNSSTGEWNNTQLKTVNGNSLFGSGNITISGGSGSLPSLAQDHFYVGDASSAPVDAGNNFTWNGNALTITQPATNANALAINAGGGGAVMTIGSQFRIVQTGSTTSLQGINTDVEVYGASANVNIGTDASTKKIYFNPNLTPTLTLSGGIVNMPATPATYTTGGRKNLVRNDATGNVEVETSPVLATVATSGNYNDLTSKPTIPTNNNQLSNGAGYITSIAGLVTQGTNISISGSGTSGSPYQITNGITNNNQLTNGSGYISNITGLITQGTNVTITGSGTAASPYNISATGGAAATGTLVGVRVLTSGTTYTPTTGTTKINFIVIGGGGGGGGVTGAASSVGAAGGGAAGGVLQKFNVTVSDATTYTISIGAAGTAGQSTGTNGGGGGNTSITISAVTYTANGGGGGQGQTTGTALAVSLGGQTNGTSNNGDINGSGQNGDNGIRLSGAVGISGAGGTSGYGTGGFAVNAANAGTNASGFGSGGGGALSTANAAKAGGTGSAGAIIIYEFK